MTLHYPRITGQIGGNTDGVTANISTGTYVLVGGANITLSQNSNTVTIVGGAGGGGGGSQTAGISNLGNTSGTTGIASGSAVALFLAGGNNITLSQSVNGASATVTVSAFNQAAQSSLVYSNANGVTFGTAGSTLTASVAAQVAQSSLLFSNANGVTFGTAGSTLTASVAAQTVESQSGGISNLGNTSGTTGIASGGALRMLFAGGANITLSQSINGASATITISGGAGAANASQTAGISNLGNTSGTSGIASGSAVALFLAGGNNITLSQSVNGASATVTISGGAAGGGGFTASSFEVGAALAMGAVTIASLAQNTLYFVPDTFPYAISAVALKLPVSIAFQSSAAVSCAAGFTAQIAIYTRNSTNSDSLARHYSTSMTMSGSFNSNLSMNYAVNTGIANSTSYNVLTVSSLGDGISLDVGGARELIFPISSSFSAGEYWMAYLNSSSSAGVIGSNFRISYSVNTQAVWRPFQHSVNTALGALRNIGLGQFTVGTAAFPANVAFSDVSAAGGASFSVVRGFIVSATQ